METELRERIERRLEAERDRLESQLDGLGEHRAPSVEGDEGAAEREQAELDDREADARRQLDEVEAAFDRLADDTIQVCDQCGREIPEERLLTEPTTILCPVCADT